MCHPWGLRRAPFAADEKSRGIFASASHSEALTFMDTTAALRGSEIGADVILKATKVDGIYDADPIKNPDATRFERITFQECLQRQLKVMDATAFSLCEENNKPIIVFDMGPAGNVRRALLGDPIGTFVSA